MSKRRFSRMCRNTDLGDGCRTVFLPTLTDLTEWWAQNRAQFPVMAYFRPGLPLLPSCPHQNEECEWVVGGTVEAVVRQMFQHLGLSANAVWIDATVDDCEGFKGQWSIPSVDKMTGDLIRVCDPLVDASTASREILRQLPFRDQQVLSVYAGPKMDDFIASEIATRGDGDHMDFYGYQNESRKPRTSA